MVYSVTGLIGTTSRVLIMVVRSGGGYRWDYTLLVDWVAKRVCLLMTCSLLDYGKLYGVEEVLFGLLDQVVERD